MVAGEREIPEMLRWETVAEDPDLIEVTPVESSVRDVLYELARQAIQVAKMRSPLSEDLSTSLSDEILDRHLAHLTFPADGKTILRIGRFGSDSLVDLDYVDGLNVKFFMSARDGKILVHSRPYDLNHAPFTTLNVLRSAELALQVKRL